MGIVVVREAASPLEIAEMRSEFGDYIKLAVDLERGILAGGGELHVDSDSRLLYVGCWR